MPPPCSHKKRDRTNERVSASAFKSSQGVRLFWSFLLILLLVLLNGFFVSVEFAAVTSRRARIDLLAESGNLSANIVKTWLENPAARDRLIAASQLGITLVSLALGAVGENTFEELLTPLFNNLHLQGTLLRLGPLMAALPLILSLVIVTSLHVVLGEQVPKVATLHNPERYALLAAQPMRVFSVVFKWFIDVLDWATRQVLALVGLRMVGEHLTVYTVEEIKHILSESQESGVIQAPAREMLDAIFDLRELVVRQVMIPRTEIIALEAETPLAEMIQTTTQSKYTKFPVYEDNLDQILGILHVKDLLRIMQTPNSQSCTARALAREPIFAPETISVDTLLQQFRDNRQHIAIVLDEFGGTAGLVTLEDLLEEIVGEVSDPFDTSFARDPDAARWLHLDRRADTDRGSEPAAWAGARRSGLRHNRRVLLGQVRAHPARRGCGRDGRAAPAR